MRQTISGDNDILWFYLYVSGPNQPCGLLLVQCIQFGQKNNPRHHQAVITNREAMNPFMHESGVALEAD